MLPDPPPLSPRRFKFVSKLFKSWRAERRGDFERAVHLLDEAAQIMPLPASDRVNRAMLLLRSQRDRDAHIAFDALRSEFRGSENPDLKYLRHYCTAMLSMLVPGSGQWAYEAKQAQLIDCRQTIKRRFPLVTVDEIYDAIEPRS
jgi:hypothetical protein